MADKKTSKKHVSIAGVLLRLVGAGIIWSVVWIAINPDSIPAGWNPLAPLRVEEPVTPFTHWRLRRVISAPEACLAALATAADFTAMGDFTISEQCHIQGRVGLAGVGGAVMRPVETRCAIALRVAIWERHSLRPAGDALGTTLTAIDHIGSYNCREMRTGSGASGRMSTHATADAIDITGFRFLNGSDAQLTRDWDKGDAKATFLRAARDGACEWFRTTLSPDYNALHTDHFHLQSRGWGTCR